MKKWQSIATGNGINATGNINTWKNNSNNQGERKMEKLIGQLCMAANKAEIELTAAQLERLGKELERMMAIKPAPVPTEKPTDSKIESVDVPTQTPAPATPAKVSKPKMVKKKATGNKLSPRENQMWNYFQTHPGASIENTCTDMGISKSNYYLLRKQLKNKGYAVPSTSSAPKAQKPADEPQRTKASEKYGRNILKNIGNIHQAENRDMNQRMEDAYMGEHMNIQPEPVQKKPVSEKAQRLYEYMKSHPDSRMPKTCEDLGICNGDYYMLKAQLKKNGWIESAVENVQAY